ncbi:tyrosine-type recombinase/integrase [Streptomyces sp. GC420]|uniref:tyrosine-type recombinase/integrase n=1 Tax=Streptomyces sp. GC420 TaxID=2697568 RepID=UPI001414F058|nr:tyrosine-type recombinase/integrase [Streptomyces sp. GC420]NBM14240.1 tyrosine-type recombinase/integrase [Streptomyces sp. GC420]
MRVREGQENGSLRVELLDESGEPVEVVSSFLRFLAARDCSPNTLVSYAYDLRHLWLFFAGSGLSWERFGPPDSIALLEYLRSVPSRRPRRRMTLSVVTMGADGPATKLAASTVNRILAAVSSFYEYVILSGLLDRANPLEKRPDPALGRVSERHRPFMGRASRQRPVRRAVRVKTVQRVPRPLSDDQVQALLAQLRGLRDKAIVLLMFHGGLRPGEVLGLHLDDLAYGRRRVVVRHRDDHPKGARSKSRYERVVDLHEAETLAAVSAYVMGERPAEADSRLVFLIGGRGTRRLEALSYDGLVRMFSRACTRAGIREPWVTPHALRHTHATSMWEGGMRELTLQKRLGHASPESTRIYTRVSDPAVVTDYHQALDQLGHGGAEK